MHADITKTPITRGSVSPDWATWGERLAEALAQLNEDEYLVISSKRGNRYVQFAGQGSFGLRAETVSNEFLDEDHQLTPAQIAALVEAGWSEPTHLSTASENERDPNGSINFHFDAEGPDRHRAAAALCVRTFVEFLGVRHPGHLQYDAFESAGRALDFPMLGLKRNPGRQQRKELRERLRENIRTLTGLDTLDYDKDGEIMVGVDHIVLCASLIQSGTHIRFRAYLLNDVELHPDLYESLNDLNAQVALVRYAYAKGRIFSTLDIPATCSDEQLAEYFRLCEKLGNAMSASFKAQFGGTPPLLRPAASAAIH